MEIFDGCPLNIKSVSWKYLIGVLEIFDGCPHIFVGYTGNI